MRVAKIQPFHSQEPEVIQIVARVTGRQGDSWRIEKEDGELTAILATSCLVLPVPGDRVLAAQVGDECWIQSILERQSASEDVLIETSGNLNFRSRNGGVGVSAAEAVKIETPHLIDMKGKGLSVAVQVAEIVTGKLSWAGRSMDATFDGIRVVGRFFDSVLERFSRKTRHSLRMVEDQDCVRSGAIDYRAESSMSLQARNLMAKADNLAKFDGDQIHLG